ncbi:MAG: DUF72 domain-containing protein [Bacillota bacterium]
MILVGTAGFSYADWRGVFYPEAIKAGDMLAFYCRYFPCLEIDFTYYQLPARKTIEGLLRKAPDDFSFIIKANRKMTHEIGDPSSVEEAFGAFTYAIQPLLEAGKLGGVLYQFPFAFRPTPANVSYLKGLQERMPGAAVIVEYRNASWYAPWVFSMMKEAQLAFCAVDEPEIKGLMPRVVQATATPGYVRFHGRNKEKWYNHKNVSERYDYLYSREELMEWVGRIRELDREVGLTYVIFNNCHHGSAPRNALDMQLLLEAGTS